MKREAAVIPHNDDKLYKDIDTLVEKLGNIAARAEHLSLPHRNHIIQYFQAELRHLKLGGDMYRQAEQIRNLRAIIGLNTRKYRGE